MQKQTILLVDDKPNLLKLGKAIFETGDYIVITAGNGIEAIDILTKHKADLIITDILMPGMDGYTLCYLIRNSIDNKNIPIIIYSATYTTASDGGLALEIGADLFIRKPASMDSLLAAAKDLIDRPRKESYEINNIYALADVTREYNARLIDKLEDKNQQLEAAHEKLIKSESKFKALVENSFDAISMIDAKGDIVYQSPSTLRMLGYLPEDTIGKRGIDFFHPDDRQDIALRLETALKNPGVPIFRTNRMLHKDGHYIWTEGTTTNLLEDENVKAFVGNFRDITETLKKQKQIEFDQHNLDALINNTDDLMWSVDKNYKLITSNNAFETMVKYMSGDTVVKGSDVLSIGFSEAELAHWKNLYVRAFSGESFTITEHNVTPVEYWTDVSFSPIRKGGNIVGTACYAHNITERKKAEEKIKQSEADLKAIFENSSESLILTDPNGIIIAFNKNANGTTLLTSVNELQIGANFFNYIQPSRQDIFNNMIAEVIAGKSIQYDQSIIDTHGDFHCYDFSINPVKKDGVIKGICFNGRNITNRKLAEEKIEQSEQQLKIEQKKFSDLFQQAPSCICILTGEDYIYDMVNPLYLQMTGKKDIIGKRATDVFPELVEQGFIELLNHVYKTGIPYIGNEQFIQIDVEGNGVLTDHYMNFVYQPYKKSTGETEGIFFFANLVTEQVIARKKIEQNEKYFRALVENAGDIISLTDKNGHITYVSPAMEKVTGFASEEIIGKSFLAILHPDDEENSNEFFNKLLNNPNIPSSRICRFLHKRGHYVWVEGTVNNLLADENVKAIVSNHRDITERKNAEEKIIKLNRLYSFLSNINQTIVHVDTVGNIFKAACKIAVGVGKFTMAWVGIIDKENCTINLIEEAGILPEDIPMFTNAPFEKSGPQDYVLQTGNSYKCNDIENELTLPAWKNYAQARGMNSCMVIPIRKAGVIIATFNLYATETGFFDEQEAELLEEVAGDISFAIDVFEKDRHRKQIEQQVINNELRLKQAQAIAHFGSWDLDMLTGGLAIWSDEHCRIYGLLPEDNMHSFQSWVTFLHPDDREVVVKTINDAATTFSDAAFYHRIIHRDGTIKYIYSYSHFEVNKEGRPISMHGVSHDVTEEKEAKEKIINVNRLYAFISNINQTIVQVHDETTLFQEACRIAIQIGKFDLAWVSIPDKANKKLNVVAHSNATESDLELLNNLIYDDDGPIATVLRTGKLFAINDFELEPEESGFKKYAASRGIRSCIVLPIMKSGETIGAYNLVSAQANLFDDEEIRLLKEATCDISFALNVFEKEKHRKQMEDKALHSELQLKQAQSIAHLGSWDIDFSTGRVEWSEEACRIYGLDPCDNLQSYEGWLSFIHPDDLAHVLKVTKEAERALGSSAFLHRIVRKDGVIRHVYSQAQFKFDKVGKPTGLNGVAHDITEMKEAENALAQSDANLRLIMDLVPQSIFAKDYHGRFVFINKSFAALYGMTPVELLAKSIDEAIPVKAESEYFIKQDQEVISSGKTKIIPEHTFTDHKGNLRIFHTTKVPFVVAGTNEKAVLGITVDITEQRQTETERSKMIADIVQRNKDLEQFSYIISHNLRAPVANILGITNLIQTIDLEGEEEKSIIESLSVSTKKLDDVILDLNYILQVKHKENKKIEKVLFAELLSDIKLSISHMIASDNVKLVSDFSAIAEIFTVKSYIYSIFFNLISNSIKYRRAEIHPIIEITSIVLNNKVQIIFKDNGMGIDLKKKETQVFGLYKRFHAHVEGKGMGLYHLYIKKRHRLKIVATLRGAAQ